MANRVATRPNQTKVASESVEPTFNDYTVPGEHFTRGKRGAKVLRKPSIQYKFQASSLLGEISYFKKMVHLQFMVMMGIVKPYFM
jgi:hypothetical protein